MDKQSIWLNPTTTTTTTTVLDKLVHIRIESGRGFVVVSYPGTCCATVANCSRRCLIRAAAASSLVVVLLVLVVAFFSLPSFRCCLTAFPLFAVATTPLLAAVVDINRCDGVHEKVAAIDVEGRYT
jgi:hypothetical protein